MSYSIVLRTELALALGLVAADRVGRFEVETGVKEAFQHGNPRLVFAVVKGEGQDARRLQDAMRLTPALREEPLIEGIGIFRLARTIGNDFEGLGVYSAVKFSGYLSFKTSRSQT